MVLSLEGKPCAQHLLSTLKVAIEETTALGKRPPQLVVIQVGQDPASSVYVRKKKQMAESIGMQSKIVNFDVEVTSSTVLKSIHALNEDPLVDGILLQLPLPSILEEASLLEAILPEKDVDGFHPFNVGRLSMGLEPYAKPCTPVGMMTLLAFYGIDVAGKHAVIVGRSNIVGKPMAQLLLQANATVTVCHRGTQDLKTHLKMADLVILAIGQALMFKGTDIKAGAVVLDVGINRLPTGQLVGDGDYPSLSQVASALTPVPGGVGPMTIATLLQNTFDLYQQRLAVTH